MRRGKIGALTHKIGRQLVVAKRQLVIEAGADKVMHIALVVDNGWVQPKSLRGAVVGVPVVVQGTGVWRADGGGRCTRDGVCGDQRWRHLERMVRELLHAAIGD